MAENESIVSTPITGESLSDYLQRYTDNEYRAIVSNSDLSMNFSTLLQRSFSDLERAENELENLLNIIQRLNNFDRLQNHYETLLPAREELLESLKTEEDEIVKISKYCSFGRFLGSTVDITGTAVGLWLKNSKPASANLAFGVATMFGLLTFASTPTEKSLTKNILDKLMLSIQRDQMLMVPIQRWYQQCNELEEAMRAVFPFDITNDIVRNFSNVGNEHFTPVRLLSSLIRSVAEWDIRLLRDEGLVRNLINFTLFPASQDWCEWIIFHRHPVMLDITRILLQLQNSPPRFILTQSIPALAIGDQSITSLPVLGRIGLNLVTIYDAIKSLHSSQLPTVASEIRRLREHLASELAALRRIVEFVQSRRNRQN